MPHSLQGVMEHCASPYEIANIEFLYWNSSDSLMAYILFPKGPFAVSTIGSRQSRFRDAAGSDQNWFNGVETANGRGWTRLQK